MRKEYVSMTFLVVVLTACTAEEEAPETAAKPIALTLAPASACDVFEPNQTWMQGPFRGDVGTFVADVTGDGLADAIAVNRDGIYVRRSDGTRFLDRNEKWTLGPFLGDFGRNFFADVTGDGLADAIVVNNDKIYVRRSNGNAFEPNEVWTCGPYLSNGVGQMFADVDGNGTADAIVFNKTETVVRLAPH